ncbi:hypothetical protein [Rhizobium sp. P44RR-XXIV]|uniref:hypothetical protein n=1 Tax=Rhizobium sp. P44RR-XXIV TaxID=1921145 RepID=UPI0010AB207F|nr:hypothetical protein [Rhizobium sp. P44RR-XXIV]TIX89288.1 hypothetical protein BSK43_022085 [Rhizobium sp. P44RR-XXIV]
MNNFATKTNAPSLAGASVSQGEGCENVRPQPVAIKPSIPHTPYPTSATLSHPLQSNQLREAVAASVQTLKQPWRKLWPHQKLALAFIAAEQARGISFTLNLSSRLQDTLSNDPDPARLLSHYINRELKKVACDGLPYAFAFEVSPSGQLHIHGVVVPASLDEDHVSAIDRALGKAGGKLKAANIVRRAQSYLGPLYDGHGWFAYLQKTGDDAAHFLGTAKVTFISNSLKKLCTADD